MKGLKSFGTSVTAFHNAPYGVFSRTSRGVEGFAKFAYEKQET